MSWRLLKPLERLAIFDADPVPRLALGSRAASSSLPPERIALHPGSGSERKNWPEPKWAEFVHALVTRKKHTLLLVGGEAEGDRLERLAKGLPAGRIEIARSLPLPELAIRLGRCAALVGHDSGISHLAAAVGVPVLGLWGETAEAVWRPRGERVRILREPAGLARLETVRVLAELERLLEESGAGALSSSC